MKDEFRICIDSIHIIRNKQPTNYTKRKQRNDECIAFETEHDICDELKSKFAIDFLFKINEYAFGLC